jgi:hypothetical protein
MDTNEKCGHPKGCLEADFAAGVYKSLQGGNMEFWAFLDRSLFLDDDILHCLL